MLSSKRLNKLLQAIKITWTTRILKSRRSRFSQVKAQATLKAKKTHSTQAMRLATAEAKTTTQTQVSVPIEKAKSQAGDRS